MTFHTQHVQLILESKITMAKYPGRKKTKQFSLGENSGFLISAYHQSDALVQHGFVSHAGSW